MLHHEEKQKWEAWEPGWKGTLTEEERKLLDFTNELRLDEVKRAGANTFVADGYYVVRWRSCVSSTTEPTRSNLEWGTIMFHDFSSNDGRPRVDSSATISSPRPAR